MISPFTPDAVRHALGFLMAPGQAFELRILGGKTTPTGFSSTYSGYFDNAEAAVTALGTLRGGWRGAYLTVNPINPALLARRKNRIDRAERGESTKDTDILSRRWLLVDCDAVRPSGISSTEAEHTAALDRAQAIDLELQRYGFPAAMIASSGNGAHLMYLVDLPAITDLPRRFLAALAGRFNDAAVTVDPTVCNPSRIWKLYGTLVCKGDSTPEYPHRMAMVLAMPELIKLNEAVITTYCGSVLPATPVLPAPAARATHAPAVTAGNRPETGNPRLDALFMCQAAGLEPDEGKPHSGGGTTHPLGVCPCPRALTDRSAFLSLLPNGAIGLGCNHATCEFSTAIAKPGEHWKRFRQQQQGRQDAAPVYDAAVTANRVADWAASKQRGHAPTATPDFMAGIIDNAATTAQPIPPPVVPRDFTRQPDGRIQINTQADHKLLCDKVLSVLQQSPDIYVSSEGLARIKGGTRLRRLSGGALDRACNDHCEFIEWRKNLQSGLLETKPSVMPRPMLAMIENLTEDEQAQFRIIEQVVSSPFISTDGEIKVVDGYDEATKTLLVNCPPIALYFRTAAEALAYLHDWLSDFPFESAAERSNFIGAMLAIIARPLIDGPMPMLLLEANSPGVGKTLLAQFIQVVYGLAAEIGPLPRDEMALSKLLLSILLDAKPVHVFDNVKHAISSESLDMVLTSRSYTDRLLGQSKSIRCPVKQLWVLTVNNGRLSGDMVRRVIRCRLQWDGPGKPEERMDVKQPNLLADAQKNRGNILSALVQVAYSWMEAGRPTFQGQPRLGTFESFSTIIGGMLFNAGDTDWLGNLTAAKEETAMDDGWEALIAAWAQELPATKQSVGHLMVLAIKHELLGNVMGDGSDASKGNRLAQALAIRKGSLICGYKLVWGKDPRTRRAHYSIVKVDPTAPMPIWH